MDELEESLKHMKSESAPGFDGFTVPFYKKFWPTIGSYVLDNIHYAHEIGAFSVDQRRGVIKMLPKRNKNPAYVKNLRPITLLNVDYKLLTKTLATRLRGIIPTLLHEDQKGFVRSHFLGESVIELQTLMHMAANFEIDKEFAILLLDIYKAFDSIN